jgi:gas vesicle protein
MKNPFEKKSPAGLIAGIAIGGVVAAGLAYLFFTEEGEELLADLKHKLKDLAKDTAAGVISKKTGFDKTTVKKAQDRVVG